MLTTSTLLHGTSRACEHPCRAPEMDKTGPALGPSPRILVVDDEQHVLNLTARMLREEGYTVAAVTSAELALEWLATAEPVDLVLTDIAMPGMSGMKLAEVLQRLYP